MAFSPAWGGFSPIPLVQHGQLRDYLNEVRNLRKDPPIMAGTVLTPASLGRSVAMALASAGFMAAYARAVGIAPERVDSEQLFRDIKAFLKSQQGVRVSPNRKPFRRRKAIPGPPLEPSDHDYEPLGFFTFVSKRRKKRNRVGYYTPSVRRSI